jgi:DNA-binding CsgD family transcriptional regulator
MIDRDQELSFLENLFRRSTHGMGVAAVVTGPMASGKTELLRHLSSRALNSGAIVLTANCSDRARQVPLGVMRGLLRSAPLQPATRAWLAQCGVPPAVPAGAISKRLDEIAHNLCTVLLQLAARGPVLVCVDELRNADDASLHCLRHLARHLHDARILAVFSEPDRQRGAGPVAADPLSHPDVHRLRLAPFTHEDVERVLARSLGTSTARTLSAECHAISGGIPMLVRALTEDCLERGHAERLVTGEAFDAAVSNFLRRAPKEDIAMAQVLAVLGDRGSLDLAGRSLGMNRSAALDCVQALNGAGLLASGRYRHRAALFAVLRGLTTDERRRHYLGVTAALGKNGSRRDESRPSNSLVADLSYALSDAELRVASLAALGYTNREISSELRITISTVEQHLTRTYRKLAVKGRAKLAERLLVETLDRC